MWPAGARSAGLAPTSCEAPCWIQEANTLRVRLQFTIAAPDDVLQAVNETYALMEREIDIEFLPIPDMSFHVSGALLEHDPRVERYDYLRSLVPTLSGIFRARRVTYQVDPRIILVELDGVQCPTLDQFRAAIEVYEMNYGFDRIS